MRFPIVAALLFILTAALHAAEKYSIAAMATLIVVGTLHENPTIPWLDGWHYSGTIEIEEVLYGSAPASHVAYRWLVKYPPPPLHMDWRQFSFFLPADFRTKGLWFLKPYYDDHTWQPSFLIGHDALSTRAGYEDYIRRNKH